MNLPAPEDVLHKIQLSRLLMTILDNNCLARNLYFKGGSAAAMLGWLDRFSIDLDFDLAPGIDKKIIKENLLSLFQTLNLQVKNPKIKTLQFILRYPSKPGLRNQLKLGIVDHLVKSNDYQPFYLPEIDRYALCQTRETMVANKLVAPLDRFEKYKTIAGRDIYDIHYFLSHGYSYKKEIIEERRKMSLRRSLTELKNFIDKKLNERIISEDLSYLLPKDRLRIVRQFLKPETLLLLSDEIKRHNH